jgi:hypothetical protein
MLGDGALGKRCGVPRHSMPGFLHAIRRRRGLAGRLRTPDCSNDGCRLLLRVPSLSPPRSKTDALRVKQRCSSMRLSLRISGLYREEGRRDKTGGKDARFRGAVFPVVKAAAGRWPSAPICMANSQPFRRGTLTRLPTFLLEPTQFEPIRRRRTRPIFGVTTHIRQIA